MQKTTLMRKVQHPKEWNMPFNDQRMSDCLAISALHCMHPVQTQQAISQGGCNTSDWVVVLLDRLFRLIGFDRYSLFQGHLTFIHIALHWKNLKIQWKLIFSAEIGAGNISLIRDGLCPNCSHSTCGCLSPTKRNQFGSFATLSITYVKSKLLSFGGIYTWMDILRNSTIQQTTAE